MKKELNELVKISNYFGRNKDYVIAGGGNTSFKDEKHLWVKGSGTRLCDITIDGFVQLERGKLKLISSRAYSKDTNERERQVKADLNNSAVYPEKNIRPSVETSLHNIIDYKFVVHTHPTIVNSVLCSRNSGKTVKQLFGEEEILYIPFIDPGYKLFKCVEKALMDFRKIKITEPKIIFLENHGVIVCADNIKDIKSIYRQIEEKIDSKIKRLKIKILDTNNSCVKILPAIRMITSENSLNIVKIRNNNLIQHFCQDKKHFGLVAHPFTPDMVVYCKANFLYIDKTGTAEQVTEDFKKKAEALRKESGHMPKVILIKNIGMIAVDNNSGCAEIILDIYQNLLEVSYYSQFFGGPKFLTQQQIDFIDNWEVENYRRTRATSFHHTGRVSNKIVIITGGAQGFGKGIAEGMFNEGANVVIADIKDDPGKKLAERLDSGQKGHVARFYKADVTNAGSVLSLINYTVKEFGGLDVIVSNAGILQAGSIDEMSPETFERVTRVNYIGYFHCVKYASQVMKLQRQHNRNVFMDIIQINSKSGLKGSNRNFAYAGGKFGGIGLTQSFALELMPFNIKVNSICPGNYFDGPLWDDPDNGLFVQYLRAGKVPNAKTIADVRRFYESQVPANRGCRIEDIMKAIFYVIEQEYETGQAIPVTGGQVMLK
jgi:rhamnose utilization protein RhaD (predicted bifunctional aldolase and dehydrogenase)/NAD(P)-dependent dehydrogenase (short-subunit alcohol dehydrogenase family)